MSQRSLNPRALLELGQQLLALPRVELSMFGSEQALLMYKEFTKSHPRLKLIQNKRWGVALLQLPKTFDDYLRGNKKQALRSNRKRALAEGFSYRQFTPTDRIEEILEVNQSAATRQGKPIHPDYLSEAKVRAHAQAAGVFHGVFNREDKLRAYAYTPVVGEVFVISRLLGHAEDQDSGIMYFLISEVTRTMIDRKLAEGYPAWAMYDTYFGASAGLRYFKERLGFEPFKVSWRWQR